MKRSNLLVDHALGNIRPSPGEVWRTRKSTREVRIDEVSDDCVQVTGIATGRHVSIRLDVLIANYVRKET